MRDRDLKKQALKYHAKSPPGKLAIKVTKPADSPEDLSLAYSPGVAEPVLGIAGEPLKVYDYTAKSNLVGIISNGSAILGLGNLGAMPSKPVMEGKAVLFKRFANVDAFDVEVDEQDPHKFVEIVRAIAPTFGGINLEDIKAPDCFHIEKNLQQLCDIPIFHDDQHGTAIVTLAGLLSAMKVQGKRWDNIKITCLGAGAAALATLELLLGRGLNIDNIRLVDTKGVLYHGRERQPAAFKQKFTVKTKDRTLQDALKGSDIILGFSIGNIIKPDDLKLLQDKPIIFACANPSPEIKPELVAVVRDDAIVATGRSDYPNQVNNVLAFPYIFRGALDTRASEINLDMKLACAEAISSLTKSKVPPEIKKLYKHEAAFGGLEYGKHYILPKPMDPRLVKTVATAVAKAAIKTKVARI